MKLINVLKKKNIFIADYYENTDSFYTGFALFLKKRGTIKDNEKIKRVFIKRESIQSTAIARGAAAPHIFSAEFSEFTFCIAIIKKGMDFKAPDGNKVHLIFLIMSDEKEVGLHLKSLAHIARLIKSTDIVENIKKAKNQNDIYNIIAEKEQLI